MSEKEQAIKESVLQHYGQKARAQLQRLAQPLTELPMLETSACCSIPTADATTAGALEELPQESREVSMGCGKRGGVFFGSKLQHWGVHVPPDDVSFSARGPGCKKAV